LECAEAAFVQVLVGLLESLLHGADADGPGQVDAVDEPAAEQRVERYSERFAEGVQSSGLDCVLGHLMIVQCPVHAADHLEDVQFLADQSVSQEGPYCSEDFLQRFARDAVAGVDLAETAYALVGY